MQQDLVAHSLAKTMEVAERVLEKLIYPTAEELGTILKERLTVFRVKRSINSLLKVEEFLKINGIKATKVSPKVLFPILEFYSLEEDESMQDMWTNLLINYAIGKTTINVYPHLLKELSPTEARLLQLLFNTRKKENLSGIDLLTHGSAKDDICKTINIQNDEYNILIDNLFRMNLVQVVGASGIIMGNAPVAVKSNEIVHITYLGEALIKACTSISKETTKATSAVNSSLETV